MQLKQLLEELESDNYTSLIDELENRDLAFDIDENTDGSIDITLIEYYNDIEDLIEDLESIGLGSKYSLSKISRDILRVIKLG